MKLEILENLINELKAMPEPRAINPIFNLSRNLFIDKVIVRSASKHEKGRCEQLLCKLHHFESLALSFEKFKQRAFNEGVVVAGLLYRLKQIGETPFCWLYISKKPNPTKLIKPTLVKTRQYNLKRQGKPYIEGTDNFIQDCAVNGNINFVLQHQLMEINHAYEAVVKATELLGIKKYTLSLEHFEINVAYNIIDVEAVYALINLIGQYLFGEPVLCGATFVDYKINWCKRLKFYKKVHPSPNGKLPGMIRCELVLRKVTFNEIAGLYSLIKSAQDELLILATYVFNALSCNDGIDHSELVALNEHPELLLGPVTKQLVPDALKGCFTELYCKAMRFPFVLRPELLNYYLNKE